ncbi:MAG TPA: diaminopimelate epimerase [Pararhizobium sp.]|uniref:diaminopimelate epimerase n=1 Tax=Pararhizobium sp. TaxID=1977563 RepID=UPI002C45281B|nr:diaminopimelate epimerase [Pararhizobium sp.]HTO34330.1 diaminopimelate epimerase [Pararhizobium sp.]
MSAEELSGQGLAPLHADMDALGVQFIKCHGLGNDFVVVDGRATPFEPSPARIQWICDRHLGIGGDQLLVFEVPQNPEATARLRIYNIDGLEAETCLNATRCAAWLLMEETETDAVVIETIGGLIPGRRAGDHRVSLTVGMGARDWQSIPLAGPLAAANGLLDNGALANPFAINMGNPHLVYFVPDRDALDVRALAEPLQKSSYLPEQANIGVAEIVAGDRIKLVVYERPGILTAACGSGACAAVSVAWRERRITSRTVAVDMPGGLLEVTVLDDETLALTGSVSVSFHGFFPQE